MYTFHVGLSAELRSKNFPVQCEYGPEALTRLPNSTLVIVQRDDSDTFGPPKGNAIHGLPSPGPSAHRAGTRRCGVLVTIHGRSNAPGARLQDHEQLVDQIVNAVYCAAYRWGTSTRQPVAVVSAGYVPKDQLTDHETFKRFTGAVYMLQLTVETGIYDANFEGDGPDTATIDAVTTTTTINAGGDDEQGPPVTAE